MTTPRRYLLWIIGFAVLVRVIAAWYQGNSVLALPGIFDQLTYHALAQRVVDGHGFTFAEHHWPATRAGEPTAHWSFLYTLYLAAVYAVVGVQPLAARLLQAVLAGVLHTWLVYRIGRRVLGESVGIAAAFLTAGYAYFIYYSSSLLTEACYFIGILWTLDAALRIGDARGLVRKRQWVELGLAVGITGLLRQVFLLFVPLLFLWLCWARKAGDQAQDSWLGNIRRSVLGLGVSTVVVAMLIAPWTIRNWQAFGVMVPLNTNAGFAFFWGNHPIHGTQFLPLLEGADRGYLELIPDDVRTLNEGEMNQELLRLGLVTVRDDPARYVRLSMSRIREYFRFWPSSEAGTLSNLARVGSFGVCLPLMLYGVGLAWARRSRDGVHRRGLVLLGLWAAGYTAIHLLTWTLIRYRLPVDTVMLVFAALGLLEIGKRFGYTLGTSDI